MNDTVELLKQQLKTLKMDDKLRCDKILVLTEMLTQEEDGEIEADYWALEGIRACNIMMREHGDMSYYEKIKHCYDIRGRRHFDEYMIACEWDRQPNARFWLPRRKVLEGKHKIATQIQDFIDDPSSLFLGFSMPPGTGKSTLIKFLLAFIAGRYPHSFNMYVTYSDGLVRMMFESVKDILTDTQEYRHNEIFANGKPSVSAEYGTVSYNRSGNFPTLGLISLGGSVTGRTRANKFLVTDDLVKNAEMARSPERLMTLFSDYTNTLTTRTIGDNVKQIMLGTIWSKYDPISQMKEKYNGDKRYKFIAIPVEDRFGESNFEYEHPDNYTKKKIADLKNSIAAYEFSCLYMQSPIEKEGIAFAEDALMYYNGVLPPGEPDNIISFTDVAWGGGDFLSMPIGYVYGDDAYIVDWLFDSHDKYVTKPRVAGKIIAHRLKTARFEANNGGDEYADDVSEMIMQQGYFCNITTKRAGGQQSKLARIEQHTPVIKRNMYFLDKQHRTEEYNNAMQWLHTFSFLDKNAHDDAPDSLAGLADMWKNEHHGMISKYSRKNTKL